MNNLKHSMQRRLERNIISFNFVLNFHFEPFFPLSFSRRYSFAIIKKLLSNSGSSNNNFYSSVQQESSWVKAANFQFTKFSGIEFFFIFSGTRPKAACGKSSCCRSSFSVGRNPITKATDYVTFSFSFRILVVYPPLAMRIFKCFSSRDPRQKISTNDLRLRMMRALIGWHEKTNEVVAADWRYQTDVKLSYFSRCIVTAFLRAGNPCVTLQFIW